MDRQGITFCVTVAGDVCNSMSNKIVYYLKHDATYKVILYSNTKSSAEGHLLALAQKTLFLNLVNGDAILLWFDDEELACCTLLRFHP
jgi:hypothetical protein